MRRVCVFAGSSPGARSEYAAAATTLGEVIAARGLELVYGGAHIGLMGTIADAVLARGGRVVGVIPDFMVEHEVAHTGLTELRIVRTMLERKTEMAELSDAFVALPGGTGTLDETFEMLTWSQLGIHAKPCGLLNVGGYYDRLVAFLETTVQEEFVKPTHRDLLVVERHPEVLLDALVPRTPA